MVKIAFVVAAASLVVLPTASADANPKCGGKRAKFVGTNKRDVFNLKNRGRQTVVGRGGNDLIITRRGRDRICAGKGDDVVVGGQEPDLIKGGRGDDVLYGSTGADRVQGGPGADTLFGDAGSDRLGGGRGWDRIFGGLVDDRLYGSSGNDLLVGGHGGDALSGGGGDDWLRGGSNRDGMVGGAGSDTVSFATATPTNSPGGHGGMTVNLGRSFATGEGRQEDVRQTENVVGSPFADIIVGNNANNRIDGGHGDDKIQGLKGTDRVNGGPGSDDCSGYEGPAVGCNDSDPRPLGAVVALDQHPLDPGLIVYGRVGEARDVLHVEATSSAFVVYAEGPLAAGPGCTKGGTLVRCGIDPGRATWISIAVLGGRDQISAGGGLPRRTEAQFDGGSGNDRLVGTRGDDLLLAGPDGRDKLLGRRGSDALISESGRDLLRGGRGNDQLVTDDPCDGHVFDGGKGSGDIAGFARAPRARMRARLGGKGVDMRKSRCRGTKIKSNNEVLEGTRNGDILIGTPGDDPFIIGGPGDDRLEGRGGNDVLNGEEGRDVLLGGAGLDLLDARDGRRDRRLDCGPDSAYVKRDSVDPLPRRCKLPKEALQERRKGKDEKPSKKR